MGRATPEVEKENMEKVFWAIHKDARKEVKTIAKETGLTRQTVSKLLKKMEEEHIIWGYTAVGELDFLNLKLYTLLVKLYADVDVEYTLGKCFDTNREKIAGMKNVILTNSTVLHGKYDLIVQFATENLKEARRLSHLIFGPFMDCVEEFELLEGIVITRKNNILNPNLYNLIEQIMANR